MRPLLRLGGVSVSVVPVTPNAKCIKFSDVTVRIGLHMQVCLLGAKQELNSFAFIHFTRWHWSLWQQFEGKL